MQTMTAEARLELIRAAVRRLRAPLGGDYGPCTSSVHIVLTAIEKLLPPEGKDNAR